MWARSILLLCESVYVCLCVSQSHSSAFVSAFFLDN